MLTAVDKRSMAAVSMAVPLAAAAAVAAVAEVVVVVAAAAAAAAVLDIVVAADLLLPYAPPSSSLCSIAESTLVSFAGNTSERMSREPVEG